MTTYECKECGAVVKLVDGELVRTCEHDAPILANLTATATGECKVADSMPRKNVVRDSPEYKESPYAYEWERM